MPRNLADKVAVVTGAGRGIGRAVAELFAAEGAAVVVNDLGCSIDGSGGEGRAADEVVEAIRRSGGQAIASYESVADFGAAEQIVQSAVREFGRLDVLVNVAGILRDRMIFNMSEEEWDSVLAVHLKGTWSCTRHAARVMREQKSGRIISFSSTSGLYGNPGQANYGAAKDAIAGMTRVVARELGKYGITANTVAPVAHTRLTDTVTAQSRERRAARGIAVPTRALFGQPEDVAPLVAYLATDAAKDVNGQTFLVNGGMIARLSDPTPVRTIQKRERWTPQEIALLFPRTLGMDLINPAPALRREV